MTALAGFLRDVTRHKELTLGLTRRELFSPFAGSAFGIAWALLHPVLQMAVYLLVFTFVFNIRFGSEGTTGLDYQTFILSGMLPWLAWAALLPMACSTVLGSASLVKQADFPTEVLPVRTVLATLVPHGVGLAVLLVWIVARSGGLPWTVVLLPVAIVVQAVAMLGAAYLLGALCVFARDVKEVVAVFTTMGIFLVPAFYTPEMVASIPIGFRVIIEWNPFSAFVHVYRDCLFWGEIRHPVAWLVAITLAVVLAGFGHRAFLRLKLFFGNFL